MLAEMVDWRDEGDEPTWGSRGSPHVLEVFVTAGPARQSDAGPRTSLPTSFAGSAPGFGTNF